MYLFGIYTFSLDPVQVYLILKFNLRNFFDLQSHIYAKFRSTFIPLCSFDSDIFFF